MAALMPSGADFLSHLNKIDVEDLEYVERDLCFYEMVSLGFLLFGEDRSNSEFVLQKLLVLSNTPTIAGNADLLRKYASVNPTKWRLHLVEALSIIGARRVLRKLGFRWQELRQHYLPHIPELSLHIHPLLKALYKVCERMTPTQAGRLVLEINEHHKRPEEHLRFYDFQYLEVFLLDWLTRRIIKLGEHDASGADMQVLIQHFKLNELHPLKDLLEETINSNAQRRTDGKEEVEQGDVDEEKSDMNDNERNNVIVDTKDNQTETFLLDPVECYTVRRDQAGIVLIINQRSFYEEAAEDLKHLLPTNKLGPRMGTDVDKYKLIEVFSSFGYTPEEYENLDHIKLLHTIRETVKRAFLYDSLIVCILSHGVDGAVYGSNSIPVKIVDIEEIITAAPLYYKPKMLIIQACQKGEAPLRVSDKKKPPTSSYLAANAYTDMLKAMSTVPGYISMRHTETGTWFIQSLCDAVHKFGDKKHMLDILVAVTRDVTNKRGDQNEIMVPLTCHTLRKSFFLPNRDTA